MSKDYATQKRSATKRTVKSGVEGLAWARIAGASSGCGAIMGEENGGGRGQWWAGRNTKRGDGLGVQRSFNLSIMGRQGNGKA